MDIQELIKMDVQELIKILEEKEIEFSTDFEHIWIKSCIFGDNFYDYDEDYKEPVCDTNDKFLQWLWKCPLVSIADCSQCCGCAGW